MPIQFKDAEVSKKYTAVSEVDKQVRLITMNHQGMLSDITLPIADELFKQEATDLLQLKVADTGKAKEPAVSK